MFKKYFKLLKTVKNMNLKFGIQLDVVHIVLWVIHYLIIFSQSAISPSLFPILVNGITIYLLAQTKNMGVF